MPLLLPNPSSPLPSPLRHRLCSSSSSSYPAAVGGFLLRSGHRPGPPRLHAADSCVVLGCGLVTLDYLATVDAYPRPDDKIRTGELQVSSEPSIGGAAGVNHLLRRCAFFGDATVLQKSGGGNAGNALTAAARLGLNTRVISKVANDETGATVLSELNEAGIDTSHVIISDGGNTTFVYIIIDKQTKSRTCILTPGDPPMVPSDLPMSSLSAALQDVSLLYLDGYSPEMELVVAQQADQMKIPILVDAEQERTKEELEGLLSLASYIVCSGNFPKNWTSIPSLPCALLEILLQYPRAKFVIATLGEKGCMMLERSEAVGAADIEVVADSLKWELHKDDTLPTCISSKIMRLSARGLRTIFGRLLIGTAEAIPASELVDTTGCGDAFIGAVLHALSTEMPPEKMLPFASQVAGIKCRAIGARAGLPWRSDQRLAKYL
ncbi:unnamed protein product [Urochloa decumbens]|uniref:Carbohydrate kinase PfkB domain-containing protein n=1 Tax=Urochloa decumbens TaxID=240449 RepID=A0ABC8WYG4_9POAL